MALASGGVALLVVLVGSIAIGARGIPPAQVVQVLSGADLGTVSTVVLDGRLPRTLAALFAGTGLAVAGALVQALTRNPLADPGVLGVTPGAAFAVAIGVGFLGVDGAVPELALALGGAAVALAAVLLLSAASRGVDAAGITVAGIAFGALLLGITSAVVLTDPARFQAMTAWRSGDLADRGWSTLPVAVPVIVVGLLGAVLLAGPLDALALGDESAASLGARVGVVRALTFAAITLLAGASTAIAGPVAFVGLMIPHVARWIVGPAQRRVVLLSAVLGPVLLMLADVVGRLVALPGEIPAGIVTAVLGAPVLIALARRPGASAL